MLRSFCDCCGTECPTGGSVRKFDDLIITKTIKVGVEAIPLYNKDHSSNNHVCDECFPKLLLTAARSFNKTVVITKLVDDLAQSERLMGTTVRLEANVVATTEKIKGLEQKLQATKVLYEAAKNNQATLKAQLEGLYTQVTAHAESHLKYKEMSENRARADKESIREADACVVAAEKQRDADRARIKLLEDKLAKKDLEILLAKKEVAA